MRIIGFILVLITILPVSAQSRYQQKKAKLDSVLTARYYRSPYDTNYVVRPEGRWTLKVRLNQTGNTIHAKAEEDDIHSKADLSTSHKTTISVAATYRGITASVALNPAKLSGAYEDYEFNLNYYSSRLSLDFSYQRAESLSGDIERMGNSYSMESGDAKMKVVNLVGYYTFNHRRFSYPAAFNQSYIQRRSAGSWLAGISYQGGTIETTEDLKARSPKAPEVQIRIGHVGIGGGYGYNLVLGQKWLFMIFNERAAVVYNFSPRYFAGATLVMNNSVFDDEVVIVNQNKWRARAFFGFRL